MFDVFDKNKEDKIDASALGQVLRWLGFNPTERELRKYVDDYDKQRTGFYNKEHLYDIVSKKYKEPDTKHEFEESLKLLDNDNDGKIPIQEMRWILTQLGDKMTEEEADELIKEVGKEGFVSIDDFRELTFPDLEAKKVKGPAAKKGKK